MYAMRYGTAPIVRATGGLRDTVREFDPHTGDGTGFLFEHYHPDAFAAAIGRAVAAWRTPSLWLRLVDNCFAQDFSWERAARAYLQWFDALSRGRARA
jgi:starch synthase